MNIQGWFPLGLTGLSPIEVKKWLEKCILKYINKSDGNLVFPGTKTVYKAKDNLTL